MKFKKEDLQNLLWEDEANGLKLIENEIVGTSRWSIHHDVIFSYKGKLYRSDYSVGATEQQDERPYEYEGDEIECEEVVKIPVTTYKYVKAT